MYAHNHKYRLCVYLTDNAKVFLSPCFRLTCLVARNNTALEDYLPAEVILSNSMHTLKSNTAVGDRLCSVYVCKTGVAWWCSG